MATERLPTTVTKPNPYAHDLSHLCTVDPNPLPHNLSTSQSLSDLNGALLPIARDATQVLLSTLLTSPTVQIQSTSASLTMLLPPCADSDRTPRWKPLPKPKEPTKWERFAAKKGIGKYGGAAKGGAAREERRKNAVFNEETGEWEKKWGYKGKTERNGAVEKDWIVELDDEQVRKEKGYDKGETVRNEGKREKMERMRRQERKARSNSKRNKTGT